MASGLTWGSLSWDIRFDAHFDKHHVSTYNVCMIEFSWDARKANANSLKHGVSFEEAQSVFYDELAVQFFDSTHSENEDRFLMLGLSNRFNLLLICHCEQRSSDEIRIISARRATKTESKLYP